MVKTVFPNAKINQHTPGVTRNLVVKYDGNIIYDKQAGDGAMNEKNATAFATKLKKLVSG